MDYYSSTRKKEILPFATICMNWEDIMLSEISQSETNIVESYIRNLEKKKQTWTHKNSGMVITRPWGVGKMVRYWLKDRKLQL